MATIFEGNPKAPFSIATTPRCRGGCYSFPGLLYFTLDPYLIMLSVKQGGIKYHFLSLWIEPRSPGPLANTLTARPMSGIIYIYKSLYLLNEFVYIQCNMDIRHPDIRETPDIRGIFSGPKLEPVLMYIK